MTVGSMFTGIGGLDLGFESEGFDVLWMVERDPFCRATLAKHWPGVPVYNDAKMSIAQWRQVPRPDVIIGGFPCQDVSNAGARAGLSGDRSGLWWCLRRAVRVVRPEFLVVENVPGLFTRGFDVVLRSLARVGRDAEWQVVRASDVGAPQLRARVFVVAYPQRDARGDLEQRRERCGGAVLVADANGERPEHRIGHVGDTGAGERQGAGRCGEIDVADPDLGRLEGRGQSEPRGQQGERGREPDGCGAVRELDDAAPVGDADGDGQRSGWREGRDGARDARPEPAPAGDVADAAVTGPQGRGPEQPARGSEPAALPADGRASAWPGWPARPGEPQHAWEPPRVLASARAQSAVGAQPDGFPATYLDGVAPPSKRRATPSSPKSAPSSPAVSEPSPASAVIDMRHDAQNALDCTRPARRRAVNKKADQ